LERKNNWWENRNFSFVRVPKFFWEDEKFRHLPTDAIMLYSLMLDRMALSKANDWKDKKGEVYIYFTLDEIQRKMRCSRSKASKLKQILLKENLIKFEQQGKADPHRIYVLPFYYSLETKPMKSENSTSCSSKNNSYEVHYSDPNKTEINKIVMNNIYPSNGYDVGIVREILMKSIEYDTFSERNYDMSLIDNILDIMVDAICSSESEMRIGEKTVSKDMVRSRFFHFTQEDLEYVLLCLDHNTSDIKNIRSYLLVTLYNAPTTKKLYYHQKVRHDMPEIAAYGQKGGM